jgi:ATP-dependent protease ClpP protease subunit
MKEILLYGPIWSSVAKDFIRDVDSASGDITIRVNSPGGEVTYGWGIVSKFSEYKKGKKRIIVDGSADSMALAFLLYADKGEVEAVDVATFVLHRAAYYSVEFEKNYLSDADREHLKSVNDSLRKAIENKIDVEKFEKLKGVTLDEVFSMENRIDINISAKEAKQIGLIDKIITITPQKKQEITSLYNRIVAMTGGITESPISNNQNANNKKVNTMNIEQLQAEHPAVYNAIFNKGVTQGVTTERDRVGAWAAFNEIDPAKVKAGIESGNPCSQKEMAEFMVTSFKKTSLTELEKEGGAEAGTGKVEVTAENEKAKEVDVFAEKLKAAAGLTDKK